MPEPFSTYEDHKECWETYESTGKVVIHLKAGDILMKKNFGKDGAPGGLEGIISWAQKAFSSKNEALKNAPQARARVHQPDPVLNDVFPGADKLDGPSNTRTTNRLPNRQGGELEFEPFAYSEGDDTGEWTTGHVAIAIDPVRLAEQTGTGVMINTLNVTDQHIQEHQLAEVCYYVYRCNNKWIADNAARLAESFAASRPMNNPTAEPVFSKGNYTLLPAAAAVLGHSGLRKREYAVGKPIVLDKFSQNILDFCEGRVSNRSAMYCSAFVLAVYQAACVYTSRLYTAMNPRKWLLELNPVYILPRHYEGALRQNKNGYTFEGTYRWKNLPNQQKAQDRLTQIFYNFSQAIDNYANHVSVGHGARSMGRLHLTGYSNIHLLPKHRKLAEAMVENKKREMNDRRRAAHLAASRNSKFKAFFKKKDDDNKEATDLDALNELASLSNATYDELYRMRQKAFAQLHSKNKNDAMLAFFNACWDVEQGPESLLQLHLHNAKYLSRTEYDRLKQSEQKRARG